MLHALLFLCCHIVCKNQFSPHLFCYSSVPTHPILNWTLLRKEYNLQSTDISLSFLLLYNLPFLMTTLLFCIILKRASYLFISSITPFTHSVSSHCSLLSQYLKYWLLKYSHMDSTSSQRRYLSYQNKHMLTSLSKCTPTAPALLICNALHLWTSPEHWKGWLKASPPFIFRLQDRNTTCLFCPL